MNAVVGDDPLGLKYLAARAAEKQAILDAEEAERRAFVRKVEAEGAAKRKSEAKAITLEELVELVLAQGKMIEELQVKAGLRSPEWAGRPLAVDQFGRSLRDDVYQDVAVKTSNPGLNATSGGLPARHWNDNGR